MKMIVFLGDYDCMDWSDEMYYEDGDSCYFKPNSLECDENVCRPNMYSCGDGQCVQWQTRLAFQRLLPADDDCFTKRNLNYMCEASRRRSAWTLESGLCCPDRGYDDPRYLPWNTSNSSQLTEDEKCQYLFRCVLSDGFEHDCPCNRLNCTQMMMTVCLSTDHLVLYPPKGLINENVFFFYDYSQSMENPTIVALGQSLKCRGYHFTTERHFTTRFSSKAVLYPRMNYLLCTIEKVQGIHKDFLSPFQYDKFCWNQSLKFNGRPYAVHPDACSFARDCISQYRIHDGYDDCLREEDEDVVFQNNYYTGNVGQHRFQCFNDQHKCLTLHWLGTGTSQCSNKYDEMWYGLGDALEKNTKCYKSHTTDCSRLKEYIGRSSTKNSSNDSSLDNSQQQTSSNQISFRSYCDSFWDLNEHIDELTSSCQYWICQQHQYQCQTGQCIELDWVCDGEWDCEDASDEEALVLIQTWSIHNAHLSGLNYQIEKCRKRYSQSPFSKICNTSFEFGCYLTGVSNPLEIQSNRPCINLTQIGDGVENCYNAYDEKNTFVVNSKIMGMWGFNFRCENYTKQYQHVCNSDTRTHCTKILCSNHRDKDGSYSGIRDVICLEDNQCKKYARCDGTPDCLHGEDEYWCASSSLRNQLLYRIDKYQISIPNNAQVSRFPVAPIILLNDRQVRGILINPETTNRDQTVYSYQCNRGVSILEMNETKCLCPPAYYGRWCEFFSDRISIIVNVDQKTLPKTLANITLKVKTTFLFNNLTIDSHEFNVIPAIENLQNLKHKFYLLYSRSNYMLSHKRWRYFNQTDVNNHHPYSVHFDVFSFKTNTNIKEIGSWYYEIYFDYVPAFRLAVVLRFPSWFGNTTLDPCR